jgi:branched-chain amino acid transport system ATP-binding protein
MTEALLRIDSLSKSFGSVAANRAISLDVPRGTIAGLIGPNGSGKTTLFSLIAGNQAPDSGTIHFDGSDITTLSEPLVARRGLQRTFQQPRVFRAMTCLQNVLAGAPATKATRLAWLKLPDRASRTKAHDLLAFVGLANRADDAAGLLSFGQQKLLEFAMSLTGAPRLLLLDEPLAGITPAQVERIITMLRMTCGEFGITLFVIEHNMPAIMKLAETIHCLANGALIASGTPESIGRDPLVRAAYLGGHSPEAASRGAA